VRQHVEVGVKEGMKDTGRERVRHEGRHTALAGEGCAARRVVAGALSEADVTKCVRVCWGRQRGVQRTKGRQRVLIVLQSGEGGAKPHRARQTQRGSAPRRRLRLK